MEDDIDFGSPNTVTGNTTPDGNGTNANDDNTTSLDGKQDKDDITGSNGDTGITNTSTNSGTTDYTNTSTSTTTDSNANGKDDTLTTSFTGGLSEGTELEFEGTIYSVAKNGDIVDKDGKVFKAAKDVKTWLDSVNVDGDTNETTEDSELSVSSIQEALGVTIEDANGNPVEFANTVEGLKSYVDSVLDLKTKETQEAAINRLFMDKPYLKEVDDYYIANGGSLRNFGQLPDRSGIKLDKDNTQQLEYIVRSAAAEFGNKSLDDAYIKYLKDTGGLYDVAKTQLDALVEKDKATRKAYEDKAKEIKNKESEDLKKYWNTVNSTILTGSISGYKIPESVVKEVDGKKTTLTRNDFYDYLSKPIKDENGNTITGYQRDLSKLSDEDYLNKELIDAWLTFTGGSYKDLVNMAIKEEQVRTLRIKAKQQRTNKTVRISNKQAGKVDPNDIVF